MKKKRVNRAKSAVAEPRFAGKIERPAKGKGSYNRKPRRNKPEDDQSA